MPEAGLAVDTFHLLARGDDETALAGIPGDRVAYLQVADAPHLSMDVLEWSRHHRCFPGQGSMDVVGAVAAVVEAATADRCPSRCSTTSSARRSPTRRRATRCGHCSSSRSSCAGTGTASTYRVRRTASTRRPLVELFDPPAEPETPSAAFVEIATNPRSDAVPPVDLIGFSRGRSNDGSARTWFHNGGAHVVVDATSDLELRRSTALPRPSVST